VITEMVCRGFRAKVVPYFGSDCIDILPIRLGDDDRIMVGYTHLDGPAGSFLRFIVDDVAGHATIAAPILRCGSSGLRFSTIVADDETQALDKLAEWMIANKDAIQQTRLAWQAY
jgi:hypothetical protein